MLKPARFDSGILESVKLSGKPLYGTFSWEIQWMIDHIRKHSRGDIVEIGTFRGSTAREFALAFPDRNIICVDICMPAYGLKLEEVGAEAKEFPNVKLIIGDSKAFVYPSTVGAIFIDGDHTWDGVHADTQKAINYMRGRSPGTIIWHDYNVEFEVMPYLDWESWHGISELYQVQCTQLAYRDF